MPSTILGGLKNMFEFFLIFCIALAITAICSRIGISLPAVVPIIGVIAGGLLGLAYSGAAIPGATAGLLAAGSCRLL
jgi:hypothetical protein